jgi:hypothetical protein
MRTIQTHSPKTTFGLLSVVTFLDTTMSTTTPLARLGGVSGELKKNRGPNF